MGKKYLGLTTKQAQERLEQYGLNSLPEKGPTPPLTLILHQFRNPLIYILVFAALVTLALKDGIDFTVISLAVGINAVLGFFQERKAQHELLALKKVLTLKASVLRDGKTTLIDAIKLVPGDIVVLQSGQKISADGRLVEAVGFRADEAILTGESEPVSKNANDRVFMATWVSSGHGTLLVEKTGGDTEVGKIAQSLEQTKEEQTPLQNQLASLSKILAGVVGTISFSILIFGILKGKPFIQMFVTSVAVAVAAIPESLVISLTVILSLGMQKLLKRKALVRKLLVAETLGSTTVICADKTGTLTEGQMQVVRWKLVNREQAIKAAVLCNNLADSLEIALWEKVRAEDHFDPQLIVDQNPRLSEVPFSSEKKFMAVETREATYVKGAPEVMLSWSNLSRREKGKWQKLIELWGQEGLRLIAFAFKTDPSNFQFLGLVAFSDPIRPYVKDALKLCQKAGVKVKVITGDYRATAEAILTQLDLKLKPENIMEGEELTRIPKEELEKKVGSVILFARVLPQQKLKIVEALQNQGEVVAVMGDGVNDAPALKKAEIGIVVNEASEVAKETADMVLLDSNFGTVVHAIEEGRKIFENIKKVIVYLLSDSFTEVILIGASLLLGLPLPLLPAQILWINLIEDSLPAMALAFEEGDKELMKDPPRPKNHPVIDLEMKTIIFAVGLITVLLLLGLFYYLLQTPREIGHIRTIIFAGLGLNSLLYIFSCRSLRHSLWESHLLTNRFLVLSILVGLGLLLLSIHLPPLQILLGTQTLTATEWLLVLSLGLLDVAGIESVKRLSVIAKKWRGFY